MSASTPPFLMTSTVSKRCTASTQPLQVALPPSLHCLFFQVTAACKQYLVQPHLTQSCQDVHDFSMLMGELQSTARMPLLVSHVLQKANSCPI